MALKITITEAGRAALINANKSGTQAISIVSVGVSATAITADKSQTNLPDEIKRITAISGEVTAVDAIHLTAKDDGDSIYTVRSFALYLDDGTLFAIYGQSSPILEKSAAAMLLLQLDIRFVDIDETQIQFGNLDFVNPAATEKTAGVTRLTALGEAEQSTENIAVSPVELRRYAEKLARQADMIAALATKFDKAGGVINGTTSINDGILQLNKSRSGLWNTLNFATSGAMRWSVVSDDSAETGNNVGSDFHITRILDNGQQIFALNISRATGLVDVPASFQVGGVRPYSPHNDGEGSGLNAEYWRGLAPNYFTPQSSTDALVNSLNASIDRRIYGDYGIVNGGKRGFAAYNLNGRVAFCSKNADGSDDWVWLPNAIELQQLSDTVSALLATKFDKAGGVINGTTSINDGILQLNKSRSGLWNTLNFATSGAMRWSVVSDDSAETGNNVGSDFHITRILDNGQQIFALNISRATGLVDVPASFQVGGVRPYSPHNDGEGSGLNAEYWRGLAPNYFTPQSSTDALVNSLNAAIDLRIYGDYGVINGGKRGFAAYRNSEGRVAFCSKNADGSDDWVLLPNTIELQNLSATISALLATKFDKAGGVINGTTSINDGILQLNKSRSGLWNMLNFATSGAMRWSIVADDSAETGNNLGSDFHITRILDNGQQIFALNISRATGLVDVPASFQVGGVRPYSPHNDGEGSGLNAEYWRGLAPDHFVANSQIITYDVPGGHIKKINDTVELHLILNNIIGTTQLPYNFTRIDSVIPVLNRDTSRAGWCDVEDNTLNTVTISAHMMRHGNLDSIDECSGSISVYGKG